MGKRFTGAEREQIGKLVSEGLTNWVIAECLGRTEAAIRNVRYREGLKTATANQLPELTRQSERLRSEVDQLTQRRSWLLTENSSIRIRMDQASKSLRLDEEKLKTRIQSELVERARNDFNPVAHKSDLYEALSRALVVIYSQQKFT